MKKYKSVSENTTCASVFIPGIYNYCDRWCERCQFRARCSLYMEEAESPSSDAARDVENEAFWDKLGETLKATLDMLREMAEEEGIDLDAPSDEEELSEQTRWRNEARNHDCTQRAKLYGEMAASWFRDNNNAFEEKGEEFERTARMELPNSQPEADAGEVADCLDVINWYQTIIYTKIMRSLQTAGDTMLAAILDDPPKDADGSAKVALIAMDRSIAAWAKLRRYFPEKEDEIMNFLVQLELLRKATEQEFPLARAFRRPGFDD